MLITDDNTIWLTTQHDSNNNAWIYLFLWRIRDILYQTEKTFIEWKTAHRFVDGKHAHKHTQFILPTEWMRKEINSGNYFIFVKLLFRLYSVCCTLHTGIYDEWNGREWHITCSRIQKGNYHIVCLDLYARFNFRFVHRLMFAKRKMLLSFSEKRKKTIFNGICIQITSLAPPLPTTCKYNTSYEDILDFGKIFSL